MAIRPAWSIKDGKVVESVFSFTWNSGLNIEQKQKNIDALHESIRNSTGETALEISTKGRDPLGIELSAFNLLFRGYHLENVFQASKKYSEIGTNPQLLDVSPKEAKAFSKGLSGNKLEAFVLDGTEWPLEPKTAFYDYIYVSAVIEKYGNDLDLSEYIWFTDIEFNPKKSINCQARALALYKLLRENNGFEALSGKEKWLEMHKQYVLDERKCTK